MTTWNKFDDAVWTERLRLRTFNEISRATSYKGQALLELARRLELEAELKEVQAELATAIDRFEAAEAQVPLWPQPAPASKGAI